MDRLNNALECMSADGQAAFFFMIVILLSIVAYFLLFYGLPPIIDWIQSSLPKRKDRDEKKIEARQKWRKKWLWKPLFGILLVIAGYIFLKIIWFMLSGMYEAAKCFIEVG